MDNKARERLWHFNNFSDLLMPLAYDREDGLFLLDDGHLGAAFLCAPISGVDSTIENKLNALLNEDWPKDSFAQFILWTSPDLAYHVRQMFGLRFGKLNKDSVLWKSLERQGAFLQRGTRDPVEHRGHTQVRDINLIVTIKIPMAGYKPTDKELDLASRFRKRIRESLDVLNLAPRTMDGQMYVRIMNTMINWNTDARWRRETEMDLYDEDEVLRNQVLDYDKTVTVDKDGVNLGDRRVSTLSIKRFPNEITTGAALRFLGDPISGTRGVRENMLIAMNLYFPDPEDKRNKVEAKRQITNYQAFGPLLKFIPELAERKYGFDNLHSASSAGDRIVEMAMTFVLFNDSAEEAESGISKARTYFREMGFQLMADQYLCLPLFLNALPFGVDPHARVKSQRYKTMATRHVVPMMPLFGDWKGTGSPAIQLISRNGQLMNVSLFDSETNKNAIIAAQSGSGKSFLTNEMIKSYLSMGAQAWVIDVGYSYVKTCEALGGDYMQFGRHSNVCLNPFDLVRDFGEEADMLTGLLALMAAPSEPLSDFQQAQLKRTLSEAWKAKGKELRVDDIAERLLEHHDRRVRDLGHQLFPFTSSGEYGAYFDGRNNIDFRNALTVLELEELKSREHLQQVVLLQLIYQIQQRIYLSNDPNVPKLLIIDEAWDLLAKGNIADFIKAAYRRVRKYGGGVAICTQSVNDLYETPGGLALVENSANMYLLGQKAESISQAWNAGRISLPESALDLLKSVQTVKGQFSEIFLFTERGTGIGRLIVDRFNQLLFSTDPNEKAAIQKYTDQGYGISDAIDRVIEDEQYRVAA